MKKGLNILGIIGLTSTSTTTLIGCEKSEKANNNENGKDNKPESKREPQQPPEGSNGKLIDSSLNNTQKEFEKNNDKGYFIIGKRGNSSHGIGQSMFFKYDESAPRMTGAGLSSIKSIYRGDGVGEPTTPTINKDTGEIIDGKEQKGTE